MTDYDADNIFAKVLRGDLPCHKVHEDEATLTFMDIMPRGRGHCLVIPKAPARNILDISADSLQAVALSVQRAARAVKQAYEADGVTVQQFNEEAGGQAVFHLHFHVIPRFTGVPLLPPATTMEKPEVLAAEAERIRAAL